MVIELRMIMAIVVNDELFNWYYLDGLDGYSVWFQGLLLDLLVLAFNDDIYGIIYLLILIGDNSVIEDWLFRCN